MKLFLLLLLVTCVHGVELPYRTSDLSSCRVSHPAKFVPQEWVGTGVKTTSIQNVDLDGDGLYDWVQWNYDNLGTSPRDNHGAWVRWGTGPGTFGSLVQIADEGELMSVAGIGDYDDNGRLDICGGFHNSAGYNKGVFCYMQTSARTFSAAQTIHSLPANGRADNPEAFDSTGDGIDDFHAVLLSGDLLRVTGSPSFPSVSPSEVELANVGSQRSWIDINRDGVKDLLAVDAGTLAARLHNATTFAFDPPVTLATWSFGVMSYVDYNKDGVDDVMFTTPLGVFSQIHVALATPTFPYYDMSAAVVVASGDVGARFDLFDVNGDEMDDIVSWSASVKLLYAALAISPGIYQQSIALTAPDAVGQITGMVPLLSGPVASPTRVPPVLFSHSVHRPQSLAVDDGATLVDGPAGGTFVGGVDSLNEYRGRYAVIRDVDFDGDLDVVWTGQARVTVTVNALPDVADLDVVFDSSDTSVEACAAVDDVNLDGVNDIIVAWHMPGPEIMLTVSTRQLDGTKVTLSESSLGSGFVRHIHMWDMNQDSIPDAVLALAVSDSTSASSDIVYCAGLGDGTFDLTPVVVTPGSHTAITAFELDHFSDGSASGPPDLMLLTGNTLVLYSGAPSGTSEFAFGASPAASFGTGVSDSRFFVSGHVDASHPGRDLVVSFGSCQARFFRSTSATTWSSGSNLITCSSQATLNYAVTQIADLDGDGFDDIVTGHSSGGSTENIFFFHSNGAGSWQSTITIISGADYPAPVMVDFDKSGQMDVVGRYRPSGTGNSMYFHQSYTSAFNPAVTRSSLPPQRALTMAAVADLIAGGPKCGVHEIHLTPGVYVGCFVQAHYTVSGVDVVIQPSVPGSRIVFDCSSSSGGGLFSVVGGGALTLIDVDVIGASSPLSIDSVPIASPLAVSGAGSHIRLRNVTFTSCFAPDRTSNSGTLIGYGGAVGLVLGASASMEDVAFVSNSAVATGGAVYVATGSTLVCTRCTFGGNTGAHGGALGISTGNVALTDSDWVGNAASTHGGAVYVAAPASVEVTNSTFESNSAGVAGGGLAVFRSSGFGDMHITLASSSFASNSAVWGGAVAATNMVDLPQAASVPTALPTWDAPTPVVNITLSGTTLLEGSNGATYGSGWFSCGIALRSETPDAVPLTTPNVVFHCIDSTRALPLTAPLWLEGIGGPGLDVVAGAVQTPVASLEIVGLPVEAVSGSAFGRGEVVGKSMYGTKVLDSTPSVVVGGGPLSELSSGAPRIALSLGSASLSGHGLAINWELVPALPLEASLVVSLDGTLGRSVERSVGVMVGACPIGSGRGSEEGVPLVCVPCVSTEISLEVSAGVCEPFVCAPGSQAQTASLSCVCENGWYRPDSVGRTEPCLPCPVGGVCLSNASWPIAASGYYPDPNSLIEFHPCVNQDACVGAGNCASGYDGYLCLDCTGETYREKGGVCTPCPEQATSLFSLLILLPALFVVALSIGAISQARRVVASAHKVGLMDEVGVGTRTNDGAVLKVRSLPMGVFFVQLVGVMVTSRIRWSSAAAAALNPLTLSNMDVSFFAPECTVATFSAKFKFALLLPLILLLMIVVGSLAVALVVRGGAWMWGRTVQRMVLISAPLLYVSVAQATTSLFDCTLLPDGKYHLEAEPTLICFSPEWNELLPYGVGGIVLYVVGIPVLLYASLSSVVSKWHNPVHRYSAGFLFTHLRPSHARWEVVLIIKRLAFVLVVTFFNSNISLLVLILFVGLVSAVFLHISKAPFQFYAHNMLDRVLDMALLAVVVLAVLHHVLSGNQSSFSGITVTMFTILTVMAALVMVVLVFGVELQFSLARKTVSFFSPLVRIPDLPTDSNVQVGVAEDRVFVVIDPASGVTPQDVISRVVGIRPVGVTMRDDVELDVLSEERTEEEDGSGVGVGTGEWSSTSL